MRKYNIVFLTILFVVMIAAIVATLSYPVKARLFPFIVIGISIILLMGELTKAFFAIRSPRQDGGLKREKQPENGNANSRKIFWGMLAWIGGLAMSIWILGYIVALPLYTFIYLRLHDQKWRWAISLSIAMFIIVYIGFNTLLKIPLYEGLIFLL